MIVNWIILPYVFFYFIDLINRRECLCIFLFFFICFTFSNIMHGKSIKFLYDTKDNQRFFRFIFVEESFEKARKSFILNLLNFPANWFDSLLKQLVWFKILPWSKTARISRGLWVFVKLILLIRLQTAGQQVVLRINKPIRMCGARSSLIRKKRN